MNISLLKSILFLGALTVLYTACKKPKLPERKTEIRYGSDKCLPAEYTDLPTSTKKYLFLGHFYQFEDHKNRIDSRVSDLRKELYDMIWLAGDVCFRTSQSRETLEYVDRELSISSPNTLWAWGNHELIGGDTTLIPEITGRRSFNTSHKDGITYLILNTNLDTNNCENLNAQFEMIQSVCDTISSSSHLVLMSHFLMWGSPEIGMGYHLLDNGYYINWITNCDSMDTFTPTIYPMLEAVQSRGVKVIVMAGDMGFKDIRHFEHETASGITFLACGMGSTHDIYLGKPKSTEDAFLVLTHETDSRNLTWEFMKIDSISGCYFK